MSFTMATLLAYDPLVPLSARQALAEAAAGPIEEKTARLESAARILLGETGLQCADARELVGLSACDEFAAA